MGLCFRVKRKLILDIFPVFIVSYYGVFTLAVSGSRTGTRTGTWTNGLIFSQCLSLAIMVYLHWLSPERGQGPGLGHGRMGCIGLCRNFHTAPEKGQGPEQEQERMGYIPIFQVPKLFPVVCFNDISMAFRCPRQSQCEQFLHNIGPGPGTGHRQCDYTISKVRAQFHVECCGCGFICTQVFTYYRVDGSSGFASGNLGSSRSTFLLG